MTDSRKRKRGEEPSVMVDVLMADVPKYLQRGAFYRSLCDDVEEASKSISVPGNTLKDSLSLTNTDDVDHLLSSLRFWGVDINCIVPELIELVERNPWSTRLQSALSRFESNFTCIKPLLVYLRGSRKSLKLAALEGGDEQFMRQVNKFGCQFYTEDAEIAASYGNLQSLKFLCDIGVVPSVRVLMAAAKAGHLACFEMLRKRVPVGSLEWGTTRVGDHNIDCFVACYHSHRLISNDRALITRAMLYNGVTSLTYGIERGLPMMSELYRAAAKSRDMASFQLLIHRGCRWGNVTCLTVATYAPLPFAKLARANGCLYNGTAVLHHAVAKGKLEYIKYVNESERDAAMWPLDTCFTLARLGSLECLRYAHEHSCSWDSSTCIIAASYGNIFCLQYAHEHSCPWNKSTCEEAARGGHLECLQYAHEHGCPWGKSTIRAAQRGNHAHCLAYLQHYGCK